MQILHTPHRKNRRKLINHKHFSIYMPKKLYYQMKIYQDSINDVGSFNRIIISLLEKGLQEVEVEDEFKG